MAGAGLSRLDSDREAREWLLAAMMARVISIG